MKITVNSGEILFFSVITLRGCGFKRVYRLLLQQSLDCGGNVLWFHVIAHVVVDIVDSHSNSLCISFRKEAVNLIADSL
jgi:hypothetical protein